MRLKALNPHFLKLATGKTYEYTDDISEAVGIELKCPACHWSLKGVDVHSIILWEDHRHWWLEGTGYDDLSMMAGDIAVWFTSGCKARFVCRKGKVDFV